MYLVVSDVHNHITAWIEDADMALAEAEGAALEYGVPYSVFKSMTTFLPETKVTRKDY